MSAVEGDLNATIASAVQARVEAQVVEALAGTEIVTEMVAVAMNRKIEVKDDSGYRTRETTVIRHMIDQAIIVATEKAIQKVIAAEAEAIEAAITTELRKNVKGIARQLAGQLQEKVVNPYGLRVELKYGGSE